MTNFNLTLYRSWIFLTLILTLMMINLACSEKSGQQDEQESPAKELQAKLIYYALPG